MVAEFVVALGRPGLENIDSVGVGRLIETLRCLVTIRTRMTQCEAGGDGDECGELLS